MAKKAKKGRAKKADAQANDEKIVQLQKLKELINTSANDYVAHLETWCEATCQQIEKSYQAKIELIPAHIRSMTIAELIAQQEAEREKQRETKGPGGEDVLRQLHEKNKINSEHKQTVKTQRKRSVSASTLNRPMSLSKTNVRPLMRTPSESSLYTPAAKLARIPQSVVTPKFDPKLPAPKAARKPRPGEKIMAMTGSPVQNMSEEQEPSIVVMKEGKLSINLGQGKIIPLTEGDEGAEIIKSLADPMKETLKNLKDQLNKILQA